MSNGVYICAGQDLNNIGSGITKKILNQIKEMKENGHNIHFINFINKDNSFAQNLRFICPLVESKYEKDMINFNNDNIDWNNIDFVYIRRITFCSGFIKMLKSIKAKNKSILVLMEIPTYPINGEYIGIKKIFRLINDYYSTKMKHYIDYIITYSRDENIWGIKTVNICNSVDFDSVKKRIPEQHGEVINMLAVALFSPWHGYDRVIKGLYNYYRNNPQKEVHLYLIGEGSSLETYKSLIQQLELTNYVHVEGKKSGKDLDKYYDICDLALDAMGRHRSRVYYNSSLKGKEYGAKGLPIISGVETELDSVVYYKYYHRVPADDSDIDIEELLKFYDEVYSEDQKVVTDEIRQLNKKMFEFSKTFMPVIEILDKGDL